jgi:hypothetical protein
MIRRFFVAILFFNLLLKDVYAYLDPGSGSYIFQLFMATVFGAIFLLKRYFNNIKNFLKKYFSRQKND